MQARQMKQFTLKKRERLTSQRIIGELASSGRSITAYPFRVYWKANEEESASQVQIAISVSKKRFKKAIIRNKIKRRIKESYRKNKSLFRGIASHSIQFSILLVYISDDVLPYTIIEEKLIVTLRQLISAYEKSV